MGRPRMASKATTMMRSTTAKTLRGQQAADEHETFPRHQQPQKAEDARGAPRTSRERAPVSPAADHVQERLTHGLLPSLARFQASARVVCPVGARGVAALSAACAAEQGGDLLGRSQTVALRMQHAQMRDRGRATSDCSQPTLRHHLLPPCTTLLLIARNHAWSQAVHASTS